MRPSRKQRGWRTSSARLQARQPAPASARLTATRRRRKSAGHAHPRSSDDSAHCRCCVVYLDDLLVHASSFEHALANLHNVLATIRQAGLRLNPRKCQLLRREMAFLGHVVMSPEQLREGQEANGTLQKVRGWLEAGQPPQWAEVSAEGPELKAYYGQWRRLELRDGLAYRRWQAAGMGSDLLQLLVPPSHFVWVCFNAQRNVGKGCHHGLCCQVTEHDSAYAPMEHLDQQVLGSIAWPRRNPTLRYGAQPVA
ncbi:hypothetical protein AAFF_G00243680 [Aldrovandia affinis]|uniref:ribonuclease H n=1 Tax=Aldrovandia affinis TaxID=143900 RepID=A0AAD7RE89_9TELE|nr:hypothetical protein AAFF_G00243680 [Aldrovandia affinis]